MKKRNAALLATLAIAVATGLYAEAAEFTLTPPAGWTKQVSDAPALYMKGMGSLTVAVHTIPETARTPDACAEFVKGELVKIAKKPVFEPVRAGMKGAFDTREIVYTAEVFGAKMKYDVLLVIKGTRVWMVTGGNLADAYDKAFAKDVKSFFDSFALK